MNQLIIENDFISRPLIYVAGPYTNPDPCENTNNAIRTGNYIVEEFGCAVLIPHLTMLWHTVTPRPVEFWYGHDLAHMVRCDAVYRIPGASTGADAEVKVAQERDLPVFFNMDELEQWVYEMRSA